MDVQALIFFRFDYLQIYTDGIICAIVPILIILHRQVKSEK